MAKSQFMQIRIEPELKSRVEALFSEMGLSTSEAVTLFFSQVANRGEIPFTIKARQPNQATLAAMEEGDEMLSGKIPLKTFKRGELAKLLEGSDDED